MLLGAAAWLASTGLAAGALAEAARRRERRSVRRAVADALAHDLRTPLAHIQLFSDLLLRDAGGADARSRQRLAVIGRETRRLSDRVGALLLLAGAGGRPPVMVRRPLALAPVLAELAEGCAFDVAARGARLQTELADVLAEADPQALRHAVAALLDAAVAGTPAGATLHLTLSGDAHVAVVAIVTAPPEHPPLARVRALLRAGRGTAVWRSARRPAPRALALEVARIVARAHGGSVSWRAGADGSSRYVLTLPRPLDGR